VVGDSLRDLQAAAAAGARPLLVRTGNGRNTAARLPIELRSVPVFDDLAAVAASLTRM
jgi:D-glycero-D-manno-heptose 1,7-bisphosphate phosphatase